MKFKNNTKKKKQFRKKDATGAWFWSFVEPGKTCILEAGYGENLGLTLIGESDKEEDNSIPDPMLSSLEKNEDGSLKKRGKGKGKGKGKDEEEKKDPPVETDEEKAKKAHEDFMTTLNKIDRIGTKIAFDIASNYKTVEGLKEAIKKGEHLPFDDDVVERLKKAFS